MVFQQIILIRLWTTHVCFQFVISLSASFKLICHLWVLRWEIGVLYMFYQNGWILSRIFLIWGWAEISVFFFILQAYCTLYFPIVGKNWNGHIFAVYMWVIAHWVFLVMSWWPLVDHWLISSLYEFRRWQLSSWELESLTSSQIHSFEARVGLIG